MKAMQIHRTNKKAASEVVPASPQARHPSLLMKLGLVGLGLFFGVVAVNSALSAQLTGTMYPGVSVLGHDLSWKTRAQALKLLAGVDTTHHITVRVGDKVFTTTSEQLGATRDLQTTVEAAYQVGRQTPWALAGIFGSEAHGRVGFAYQINSTKLDTFASKITSEIGKPPVNAQVVVADGVISTLPDQDGVQADKITLGHLLQNALARGSDQSIVLDPSPVKAAILLPQAETVAASARQLVQQRIALSYNDKTFVPDAATMSSWLQFTPKPDGKGSAVLELSVDGAKVNGYVQTLANQVDVPVLNKKITIKNGVSSTEREGQDGTALNQAEVVAALTAALQANQPLAMNLTTHPVAFKTEYNRVTTLDVGRYIEINLSSQHLWVYQDNQVIRDSPITSGAPYYGFATVTGLFSIYAKATNVWLDGRAYGEAYNYRVLVDYWMPFYAGYGLHDAWRWRTTFGGPDYYYNGSHGCVNLPLDTAAFIYNWAEVGTPVWVHN